MMRRTRPSEFCIASSMLAKLMVWALSPRPAAQLATTQTAA